MYTFVVDVPKEHSDTFQSFLTSRGVDYEIFGRKAIGFPDTIIVIAASLTIARHVYFFIQELRKKEKDPDMDIRIRVYQEHEFGQTPHQIATNQQLKEAIEDTSTDASEQRA